MYKPASTRVMLDQLEHVRSLYRKLRPASDADWQTQRERERFGKYLTGNIKAGHHQPTVQTILGMKQHFRMSMEAAYLFFGFQLQRIQSLDFRLNGMRTRYIESYRFQRDRRIDLPLRLEERAFLRPALMREAVSSWQHGVSVRQLEQAEWFPHRVRYAQIGLEDSLTSPLPAGAIVSVEQVSKQEIHSPDPRGIYMLQFGNGYRCCGYAIKGRLLILLPYRTEGTQPLEFALDKEVRVIGRINSFALRLARKRLHGRLHDLPMTHKSAPLVDPWTHPSLRRLFAAGEARLYRPHAYWHRVLPVIEAELGIHLSERTIRRYSEEKETGSRTLPLAGHLIGLALRFGPSFSDVLRVVFHSDNFDEGLYSLEELLHVGDLEELEDTEIGIEAPYPEQVWLQLFDELGGWSQLIPRWFPTLSYLQGRVLRIQPGEHFQGIAPLLSTGSWLLLNRDAEWIEEISNDDEVGWNKPMYVLQKGNQVFCGHLHRDDGRWYLVTQPGYRRVYTPIPTRELGELRRVEGFVAQSPR